jgi:hypothetical protein
MDIRQQLREVIGLQKLRTMPTLDIEKLCCDALAEIERLEGGTWQPWDRCPKCLAREWTSYIQNPPRDGYYVWIRCVRCGHWASSAVMLAQDPRWHIHNGVLTPWRYE